MLKIFKIDIIMKKRTSVVGAFLISLVVIVLFFIATVIVLWINQILSPLKDQNQSFSELSFMDYILNISGLELIAIFIAANIMTAIVIRYFATNIQSNFDKFNRLFYDAIEEGREIDVNELNFREFSDMADSVNRIIERENRIKRELEANERYLQTVLDAQKDIIIVKSKDELEKANLAFYNFMKVAGLEEFKLNHNCISDFFVSTKGCEYLAPVCEGYSWIRYITLYPLKMHKVKILDDGKEIIFSVSAKVIKVDDDYKSVVTFHNISELEEQKRELELEASTDRLTKIANRLKFDMILEQQIEMSRRYSHSFSLILFDIDHFKKINDTHGHKVGDNILIELSVLVKNAMRKSDTFARWGGEEFAIILPQSRVKTAAKIAEKLRLKISNHTFSNNLNITCSFGVCEYKKAYSIEELIERTDQKLYLAKHSGRDIVCS